MILHDPLHVSFPGCFSICPTKCQAGRKGRFVSGAVEAPAPSAAGPALCG